MDGGGNHQSNVSVVYHIWTCDGRVLSGVNYNEAFYTTDFVDEFIEDWRKRLFPELAIA